ncbi:MAG: TonB family protein [Pseudomonadota bacterium]
MFTNPILRMVIGVPAAAIIVYGLFMVMNALISSPFEEPDVAEQRTLERIVPEQREQDVRARSRSKPKRIASADKPPPPPKLSASKSDIDLPTPNIQGSAPTELNFDRVQSLDINPVAISDRDAQPIRPPVPTYPSRAAERGIEGECQVSFNVDVRGRPYDVKADCTDSVFRREAVRAVSKVEFAPKIVRGQARERRNVIYPLVFNLQQ